MPDWKRSYLGEDSLDLSFGSPGLPVLIPLLGAGAGPSDIVFNP